MIRVASALLATAIAASAQESKPAMLDAIVVDAAGQPVTGLMPADFEIVSGGASHPIERLNLIDNLRHVSTARTSEPAVLFTPDQIHRTTVLVVDDLCMSLDAWKEIQILLHQALSAMVESGGRAAIWRSSGGTSRARQLTGDSMRLAEQVESIQFLGGDIPRGACASAAWSTVAQAVHGLAAYDGRKSVILVDRELPAPTEGTDTQIAGLAAKSATSIYQTSPGAAIFTQSTGGESGISLSRILQRESSYYVLGFPPVLGDLEVKLRRPELTLRARRHAIRPALHFDFPAPRTASELVASALNSPFEGHEIDTRLTPLFADLAKGGPAVDLLIHVGIGELGAMQDANGHYRMSVDVHVASVSPLGAAATPTTRNYTIDLRKDQYLRSREDGLLINMPVAVQAAGPRQLRVVVADTASSRMGSATALVDVPNIRRGQFAVSGIVLDGGPAVREGPAVRVFHAGAKLKFTYTVYNAAADGQGTSQLETQTKIYTGGQAVFTGKLSDLSFPKDSNTMHRSVTGSLELDAKTPPGRYILHVNATDKLAEKPTSAGQYIDFTVE